MAQSIEKVAHVMSLRDSEVISITTEMICVTIEPAICRRSGDPVADGLHRGADERRDPDVGEDEGAFGFFSVCCNTPLASGHQAGS